MLDFSLNFTSPNVHHESKVIVLVCTQPNDINIRNTIRRTWANPLFSEAAQNKSVSIIFLIGTGYISPAVRYEIQKYNDILQVDVPDSYGNLVYKILVAYRLIAAKYPDKHVLKVDSDVVLLLDKMTAHLGKPDERSIKCYVHRFSMPVREVGSKWWEYHSFCSLKTFSFSGLMSMYADIGSPYLV
ncbi:N-acetyllactosaminide 3-alpha-galactosyltransferase [Cooperia oncophora]